MPLLRWAQQGLPAIEKLQDYSAVLVRRERIRGKLSGYERVFVKIRHQPFSVYAYFQAPASVKGQEVIYVAGQNQGDLLAHKARLPATVSLRPDGLIAMNGRHYPLTEIGLVNLVRRLVEVGHEDLAHDECEVKYFANAKVDERRCTAIEIVHPVRRDVFRFHLARVFVDDELMTPIRYESYDWPREDGGAARTDRGIHLPPVETEQRIHRRRLQHAESVVSLSADGGGGAGQSPSGTLASRCPVTAECPVLQGDGARRCGRNCPRVSPLWPARTAAQPSRGEISPQPAKMTQSPAVARFLS